LRVESPAAKKRVTLRDIRRKVTTRALETEEVPLLEAVAREPLVKTQQAEKV
jgi:hypothetical protein